MKRKFSYQAGDTTIVREYNYIPVRYIIAMLITVLEVAAIIGIVIACCYYIPYFYLADDEIAMIGTINLDYRSLVHHFENGVWMYGCDSIRDLRADMDDTIAKSLRITPDMLKTSLLESLIRSVTRIFAPML